MNRRNFVKSVGAITAAISSFNIAYAGKLDSNGLQEPNRRKIKKSVKWGMVGAGKSVLEKFQLQKDIGFDGVEFVSPSVIDLDEVVAASRKTNMPVHGLVNMNHWEIRMSSADQEQRDQAVEIMKQCIVDAEKLGGDSVLLVPGRVTGENESHDDVWKRSMECIRKCLPESEKRRVKILIENVWNGFCEQPEQLKNYIDEIDSEWVKVYFDIGNAQKFAPSEKWVRVLGNRIEKLDVKGWGKENGFGKIGAGDVDWAAVCMELDKLKFEGWSTAEVSGGDKTRLAEIAYRMDQVLIK